MLDEEEKESDESIEEQEESEDLDEEVQEEEQEQQFNDFVGFFSGEGERAAPILSFFYQIPDTTGVEDIAETAPSPKTPEQQEEVTYAMNAPDYAGSGGFGYNQISRDEEVRERMTDMQMDITRAHTTTSEQNITQPRREEIDFGAWSRSESESRLDNQKDYVTKVRRKKDDDKLPFQ